MPATITAGRYTDDQARDLGWNHGHDAANYAASVSGDPFDSLAPARTVPLGLTDRERMFYLDGFSAGVDRYQIDDCELDLAGMS